MTYLPPAFSRISLPDASRQLLATRPEIDLDATIARVYDTAGVMTASSWVLLLTRLLAELKQRDEQGRTEVVLARYSCNEFSKAILVAGLKPVYHELAEDLTYTSSMVAAAVTDKTLAVFSISNCGVTCPFAEVYEYCERQGLWNIEDATYTYLGSNSDGKLFGTYGHYSIFNFSEGKIIPVGGGALLANTVEAKPALDTIRSSIYQLPAASRTVEWTNMVIYKLGSTVTGYSLYQLIKGGLKLDFKKAFSMEPTRTAEAGLDLIRGEGRDIMMDSSRRSALWKQAQQIHPLNSVKQAVGVNILLNREEIRAERHVRYLEALEELGNLSGIRLFALGGLAMPIKMAFVYLEDMENYPEKLLQRLGVFKQYVKEYPTNGHPDFPNANTFYNRLYTIPLHGHLSRKSYGEIAKTLLASWQ